MARAGNLFEGSRPTLDFIAHGFSAGLAEMDAHLVGGLANFLYHREASSGALTGVVSAVCMVQISSWPLHQKQFIANATLCRERSGMS